jgi:hypothetical protein
VGTGSGAGRRPVARTGLVGGVILRLDVGTTVAAPKTHMIGSWALSRSG